MENAKHPELHVNEEPRNDFLDTAVGFAGMFAFMLVVGIIFTLFEIFLK